mgnify:CR=1 FL=1
MIRFIVTWHGQTILTSSWRHIPRKGELIRINGELFRITEIIHDVDEMKTHRVYDVIIQVQRSER